MKRPQSVAWICPTYRRPETLPNLVACFEAQEYPAHLRQLIILDDAGQYAKGIRGDRWRLFSVSQRFPSLPAKYNFLAAIAQADILLVAEDDDTFLPWHTAAHVRTIQSGFQFSKPSRVLSDYPGHIVEEPAAGRFHGSIAMSRQLWKSSGGWPVTDAANFDQVAMAHFAAAAGGTGDPCGPDSGFPPSYVFRWHTGHWHGQTLADGPEDVQWYRRAGDLRTNSTRVESLEPQLDEFTRDLFEAKRCKP